LDTVDLLDRLIFFMGWLFERRGDDGFQARHSLSLVSRSAKTVGGGDGGDGGGGCGNCGGCGGNVVVGCRR
jgi:hypothetical protein